MGVLLHMQAYIADSWLGTWCVVAKWQQTPAPPRCWWEGSGCNLACGVDFRWGLPADMGVAADCCAAFGGVLGAPLGLVGRPVGLVGRLARLSGLRGEVCWASGRHTWGQLLNWASQVRCEFR